MQIAKLRHSPAGYKLGKKFEHTKEQNLGKDLFFGLHVILGRKTNWFWGEKFFFGLIIFKFPDPPFRKSCVRYWVLPFITCEGLAVIWTIKVEFFFRSSSKVGQEKGLNFGEDLFFRKSPNIGWKSCVNFGKDLYFFFGDHLILTKNPPQSVSRFLKIWVKFVYCCFKFPKKPPSSRNSGYAPRHKEPNVSFFLIQFFAIAIKIITLIQFSQKSPFLTIYG